MLILIDNGHGLMTPGKRSPDGQFREAFYTREIAKRTVADLTDRGVTAQLLVPEEVDIPLSVRNPDHGRPVNPLKIPLKRYSFTY